MAVDRIHGELLHLLEGHKGGAGAAWLHGTLLVHHSNCIGGVASQVGPQPPQVLPCKTQVSI